MVGVVPQGKNRRAASPKSLVSPHGVSLGRAECCLGLGTLRNPLPDNRHLPAVRGPCEALVAMLPGPQGVRVGMAGGSRRVLAPPNHEGVIGGVHLGCRAIDAGQGEQLAWELRHEHHHGRVRGEPLGAQLLPNGRPYLGQGTGARRRAIEVYVGPHAREDPGGRDLGGTGQRLRSFLRAIRHRHHVVLPPHGGRPVHLVWCHAQPPLCAVQWAGAAGSHCSSSTRTSRSGRQTCGLSPSPPTSPRKNLRTLCTGEKGVRAGPWWPVLRGRHEGCPSRRWCARCK